MVCRSIQVRGYPDVNQGSLPSTDLIRDNIIEVLNDEESTAFIDLIPSWIKNTNTAIEIFVFFDVDSDSDSDATA
jgi:hypothetical protein